VDTCFFGIYNYSRDSEDIFEGGGAVPLGLVEKSMILHMNVQEDQELCSIFSHYSNISGFSDSQKTGNILKGFCSILALASLRY
jgi:hypothetical protein